MQTITENSMLLSLKMPSKILEIERTNEQYDVIIATKKRHYCMNDRIITNMADQHTKFVFPLYQHV